MARWTWTYCVYQEHVQGCLDACSLLLYICSCTRIRNCTIYNWRYPRLASSSQDFRFRHLFRVGPLCLVSDSWKHSSSLFHSGRKMSWMRRHLLLLVVFLLHCSSSCSSYRKLWRLSCLVLYWNWTCSGSSFWSLRNGWANMWLLVEQGVILESLNSIINVEVFVERDGLLGWCRIL